MISTYLCTKTNVVTLTVGYTLTMHILCRLLCRCVLFWTAFLHRWLS